jgi:alpha-ketoglutarate-dependent taurine dioxygenase
MKITKIPGLGRFGVFIDDVDFNNLSNEEWLEIGQIHLDSLVTIIRDTKLNHVDYKKWIYKWGSARSLATYHLEKKYNAWFSTLVNSVDQPDSGLEQKDIEFIKNLKNVSVFDKDRMTGSVKVRGGVDENGRPLGMFAEGKLLWHSNESGNLCFTPQVSLLAYNNTVGSSTGFVTTTDWYEQQSESFRSELDEMVLVHKFTPGKINPGLMAEQDDIMYRNMCPVDGEELPLVITSPGGHTGLHFSVNTISSVKGMSDEESQKFLNRLNKEIFVDEYIYDHWYKQNGDLCLFDNSITLHRRLGDIVGRECYRIQYEFTATLLENLYIPYRQEPYRSKYINQMRDILVTLKKQNIKLPV